MSVVHRNIERTGQSLVDALAECGRCDGHEAMGRTGLCSPYAPHLARGARWRVRGDGLRYACRQLDIHVSGRAVREGDILVVAPTSLCDAGYFGELLATSLMVRGVRGLIIEAGVRDVSELEEIGFPVWSRFVSAQGTVKATLGSVNVPIVCAGAAVAPGDVVIADDDGVMVVPKAQAEQAVAASRARLEKERKTRERLAAGELGLDIYDMRGALAAKGLKYID